MKLLQGPYLGWRLFVFAGGALLTAFLAFMGLDVMWHAIHYGYLGQPGWIIDIATWLGSATVCGLLSVACLRARGRFAPLWLSLASLGVIGFTLFLFAIATMHTH